MHYDDYVSDVLTYPTVCRRPYSYSDTVLRGIILSSMFYSHSLLVQLFSIPTTVKNSAVKSELHVTMYFVTWYRVKACDLFYMIL